LGLTREQLAPGRQCAAGHGPEPSSFQRELCLPTSLPLIPPLPTHPPTHPPTPASLKARDWALLLWGLARLGEAPPERWLAAAVASTWHRLRFFGPQDFANVLWALARLGAAPGLPWRSR
jgi:hypothetical protein